MTTPRTCRVEHDGEPCGLPKLVMPSGALSPYCYWDRLAKTSMEAQVKAAIRRKEGVYYELGRAADTNGFKQCLTCRARPPAWYMSGSRCKADAYSKRREQRNRATYGVEPDEWQKVFDLQDGRCAICGNAQLDRSIALDHDHKTGEARGLLCKRCNHDLLGAAHDSLRILKNAVRYLEHPPFGGQWEGRIER